LKYSVAQKYIITFSVESLSAICQKHSSDCRSDCFTAFVR